MPVEIRATVLDIQRMSTEDGPGLRTTVFFKGCSLRCGWCHNPESINPSPVIHWNESSCIGCASCLESCEKKAILQLDSGIRVDSATCTMCLNCVDECPSGALHLKGESHEIGDLALELLRDRAYFGAEGGVTVSGGEPLLQEEAAIGLLEELKKTGVHTALDTSGQIPLARLVRALRFTDLLLYDLKLDDSALHRKHTGRGNEKIFSNYREAVRAAEAEGKKIWVRTPVIPGATDSVENIVAIARFIGGNPTGPLERWELCAFNNLCSGKYRMLGLGWPYEKVPLLEKAALDRLVETAFASLDCGEMALSWTGAAALEKEVPIHAGDD